MGALLPSQQKQGSIAVIGTYADLTCCKNLFQQIQWMLVFAIWRMDINYKDEDLNESLMTALISKHWQQINEVLTHCFDFLYFYRKDSEQYVRSIWTSWEIMPNISERIPDYLVRTLCALHSCNLSRKDGLNTTVSQLQRYLEVLSKQAKRGNYIGQACDLLRQERSHYRDMLSRRVLFVRLVRNFFYSQDVEKILAREGLLGPGGKEGYPLKPLYFGTETIQNPLRFAEAFCRDEDPDSCRSVWLLEHLAFGGGN